MRRRACSGGCSPAPSNPITSSLAASASVVSAADADEAIAATRYTPHAIAAFAFACVARSVSSRRARVSHASPAAHAAARRRFERGPERVRKVEHSGER